MFPSETVESGLTEDRHMQWVQLLTTANCCVHHEHVYAFTEENPDDTEDIDPVHVTEYVMGNKGDYFPEGTGKMLYAGSKFRFAPHYHPWGEEVHDISRVGIKFYPRGEVPDLEVTSHRIRTGNRRRLDVEPRESRRPVAQAGRRPTARWRDAAGAIFDRGQRQQPGAAQHSAAHRRPLRAFPSA